MKKIRLAAGVRACYKNNENAKLKAADKYGSIPIHKEDTMGDELKGFEDNCTYTDTGTGSWESRRQQPAAVPEAEAVKKEMEQTILTPEEQQMVDSFAQKIDIENTNQILQYGAGTQKKMADFSDAALEKCADTGSGRSRRADHTGGRRAP